LLTPYCAEKRLIFFCNTPSEVKFSK